MNGTLANPQSAPSTSTWPTAHEHDDSGQVDEDALIDMESDQSFPASDAPGWTLGSTKAY